MTIKQRVLKRIYEIRNTALGILDDEITDEALLNRAQEILKITSKLLETLQTEDWEGFLECLERIDLYPETAEIATLSGFLRGGEEVGEVKKTKEKILAKLIFEFENELLERGKRDAEIRTEKTSVGTGIKADKRKYRQHSIKQGDS